MHGEVENRFGGDFQGLENWSALAGLEMVNPIPHGGAGNFHIPVRAVTGMHPVVGEEAGFQDFMGFGMRYAIVSGVLAARSLLEGKGYDMLWRRELEPPMWNSMVNRVIFGMLGNCGYRSVLQRNQPKHWDAHPCPVPCDHPTIFGIATGLQSEALTR